MGRRGDMARRMKRGPTDDDWENLCDGCGQCCTVPGGYACPELEQPSNRCKSYPNRVQAYPPCTKVTPFNVEYLFKTGVLPWDCPYVRVTQGLRPIKNRAKARLIPIQLAPNEVQLKFYKNVEAFREQYRPKRLPSHAP